MDRKEIETLRERVSCAAVLEQAFPPEPSSPEVPDDAPTPDIFD